MCISNLISILTIICIFLIIIYFTLTSKSNQNEHYIYSEPNYTFPTDKLKYSGGFIDSKNCNSFCDQRFKTCQSYFPIGDSNWCQHLKTECNRDCQWNNVYNK
jgi:hypothetical protein